MHMNFNNLFYVVKNIQSNYTKNSVLPYLLINFKQVSWKYTCTCTCSIPGKFWRAVRIVLLTIKYMYLTYIVPSLTSLASGPRLILFLFTTCTSICMPPKSGCSVKRLFNTWTCGQGRLSSLLLKQNVCKRVFSWFTINIKANADLVFSSKERESPPPLFNLQIRSARMMWSRDLGVYNQCY